MNTICKYQNICGGCPLGNLSHDDYKATLTSRFYAAYKAANVKLPFVQFFEGDNIAYRARMTLFDGGLKAARSNKIIPINNCLVATNEINEYLMATPINKRARGRCNIFGSVYATPNFSAGGSDVLITFNIKNTAIKNSTNNEDNENNLEQPLDSFIQQFTLKFSVAGFFQSNMDMLIKLAQVLQNNLHGDNLLDMYSGVGTFSVFLSHNFLHTTLVESNTAAAPYAYENLNNICKHANNIKNPASKIANNKLSYKNSIDKNTFNNDVTLKNFCYFAQRASDWVKGDGATDKNFDVAVLDPPRAGLENSVASWLAASNIPTIAYVSCNYATCARDIAILLLGGYKIEYAAIFDFYHGTRDMESLIILSKTK